MSKERVRRERPDKLSMTVRLPRPVYDQARKLVKSRATNLTSMNELIIAAVRSFIKVTKRRKIDLAFQGMAEDSDFREEAQLIATEFAESDWEALDSAEKI